MTRIDTLVAQAGEIVLTRRGHPVARILPLGGPRRLPSRAGLRQKMSRMSIPSEDLLRAERNAR
jgi:antitoxin (DNA-binding transcriptional repressor) of toxin-antitoxin stability system